MVYYNTTVKKYASGDNRSFRFIHFDNLKSKCTNELERLKFQGFKASRLAESAEKKEIDNIDKDRDYKQEALCRAKRTVKEIIRHNYSNRLKLMTLTYANVVDDRKKVLSDIKNMCKRYVMYYKKELKYICTFEWQKKRECLHVHMIIDSEYIPVEVWRSRLWIQGFVKVNSISKGKSKSDCFNSISYVLKYIQKDAATSDHYDHIYYRSRNWHTDVKKDVTTITDYHELVRFANMEFGSDNYIMHSFFYESWDNYIVTIYDFYINDH